MCIKCPFLKVVRKRALKTIVILFKYFQHTDKKSKNVMIVLTIQMCSIITGENCHLSKESIIKCLQKYLRTQIKSLILILPSKSLKSFYAWKYFCLTRYKGFDFSGWLQSIVFSFFFPFFIQICREQCQCLGLTSIILSNRWQRVLFRTVVSLSSALYIFCIHTTNRTLIHDHSSFIVLK